MILNVLPVKTMENTPTVENLISVTRSNVLFVELRESKENTSEKHIEIYSKEQKNTKI